jgi:integrase
LTATRQTTCRKRPWRKTARTTRSGCSRRSAGCDLRHTFASIGAGGGLGFPIIGKLLGHTQARTTQRYAHPADDPVREAAEKITKVITDAGKSGVDVVNLKR